MAQIRKLKWEISDLKNTIITVKILESGFNRILDTTEERMSEWEDSYKKISKRKHGETKE